jgi:sugar lactone lactonase YvrE
VAVDANGNIGIVEDDFTATALSCWKAADAAIYDRRAGGGWQRRDHFANPTDVAFDADGNIYIIDQWNHSIRIFSNDGTYLYTLGTGWGNGTNQFKYPFGVAVDGSGNIYVADSGNHRVRSSTESAYKHPGVSGVSGADNGHFNEPNDVAVDSSGDIYVADTGNGRCRSSTAAYATRRPCSTSGVRKGGGRSARNLYVADYWNNRCSLQQQRGVPGDDRRTFGSGNNRCATRAGGS